MMQAVIVLGDFAERDAATGKVHILGAGWSVTGPAASAQAVIIFVKVPADRAGTPIPITLRLLDPAGKVVTAPGAAGVQRLEIFGQIEMSEPESWEGPAVLDAVFSVNVGPLLLQPGGTYSWHVDVDNKEAASTEFRVRPEPVGRTLDSE
jgi:Family of unknown function (DUF6941)